MSTVSSKNLKIVTWVFLALTLIMAILAIGRSDRGSNDYDTFYYAGRAVLEGQVIYDDRITDVSPFLYSPITACCFALLALFPLPLSAFLWILLSAYLLYLAIRLTGKYLEQSNAVEQLCQLPRAEQFLLWAMLGALALDNLSMAQINILIYFLCVAVLLLWKRGYQIRAGLLLSFAIMIKMTPALLILFFLSKRAWKLLVASALGFILLTALIPSLVFGPKTNLNHHRQWYGRTIKPSFIGLISKFKSEEVHRLRKSVEAHQSDILKARLNHKNQSADATLTRLLLKNRNDYLKDPKYPIYAIKKYIKLPVLGGGLPEKKLGLLIRALQLLVIGFLIFAWVQRQPRSEASWQRALETSLIFLSMTLLSPWARSHHFIHWTFAITGFFMVGRQAQPWLKSALWIAFALYILQALPYGKAIGMGAWANWVLWGSFSLAFIQVQRRKPKSSFEALSLQP